MILKLIHLMLMLMCMQTMANSSLSSKNISNLPKTLLTNSDLTLKKEKVILLTQDKWKIKYRVLYKNTPLYNRSVIATKLKSTIENWFAPKSINIENAGLVEPKLLSKEQAIDIFHKEIGLFSKKSTEIDVEKLIQVDDAQKAHYIYRIAEFIEGEKPRRPVGIINGKTGEIEKMWDGLNYLQATGPGGNEKIGKYSYGMDFPKIRIGKECRLSTNKILTYDFEGKIFGGKIFKFENCDQDNPSNSYKEINGSYSPINDAQYYTRYVLKLLEEKFQLSLTKERLILNVHYGENVAKSFWNGSAITLGDGNALLHSFASLDMISHEIGHIITENTSKLEAIGQEGAINESFSDITGVFAKSEIRKPDLFKPWLVGEAIKKGARGDAIRYFKDPSKDGVSIMHTKDFTVDMDPHQASGIYNHAFYLLAKSNGWSVLRAYKVFLLANRIYWYPNITFDEAACGVHLAAMELKLNALDVDSAFELVGVDAFCKASGKSGERVINNQEIIKNLYGKEDDKSYFYMDIPKNTKFLQLKLKSCSGDADLYVKFGRHPTIRKFDCRPFDTNKEKVCKFVLPKAGRFYMMIYGYRPYSNASLEANYF